MRAGVAPDAAAGSRLSAIGRRPGWSARANGVEPSAAAGAGRAAGAHFPGAALGNGTPGAGCVRAGVGSPTGSGR